MLKFASSTNSSETTVCTKLKSKELMYFSEDITDAWVCSLYVFFC